MSGAGSATAEGAGSRRSGGSGGASVAADTTTPPPLKGMPLLLAALSLGLANFLVLLDTTIANVSLPHIAGSLGVSVTQGTWIITSYAVAEAICVPLTGWLAGRFGTYRTFVYALFGFSLFSTLCGLSSTLTMLILCRIGQGMCGGPLMPLSQALLLRIFPRAKAGLAMSVAAMTTIIAPIVGPILGGKISDDYSWPWIFFINLPAAALCIFAVIHFLKPYETQIKKLPIDKIGLIMLIFWVGSFQLMLDLGSEHDWFGSGMIITFAVCAGIGFIAFLIWELTDDHPIVDLRVLRHRGFTAATVALAIGFSTIYCSIVIVPLFLQSVVGYTSTWAGYAMSAMGIFAIMLAPVAGRSGEWIDMRITVCLGLVWLGVVSFMRADWTADMDFWAYTLPQLFQGLGTPFFMIGLMTLGLSAVPPSETANAAGLMAFVRTLATALGTSIITTQWSDGTERARAALVGTVNGGREYMETLLAQGFTPGQARALLARMMETQGATISASHLFMVIGVLCIFAGQLAWIIPKAKPGAKPPSGAH
ncbi:DHA2 family efflux MFS transporter permease subunit [Altericroceibacterium endophyticum]|uniref:DHA2 family efflux MFS transporter permease subunit n=1 Tax=Altericroceibacterium endophyticum TaxID=1808508 RepID=A0A6I4T8A1_9SPHN|nr:DHA2 family efflux MFS transporter permease subunit [Altericroceibacterium endophyticum]MXO66090.1 DHA2 family efflux MFS transporter permease subunit [Altericroceibacterium endophyticum]